MAAEPWADLVSPAVGLVARRCAAGARRRGARAAVPLHGAAVATSTSATRRDGGALGRRQGLHRGARPRRPRSARRSSATAPTTGTRRGPSSRRVAARRHARRSRPADCVLYSDEQYARAGLRLPAAGRRRARVTWIDGVELPGGEPVALPASLVYLAFPPPRPEDFFAPATSNGLAAGPTSSAAVLGGLCELIERDALMITWMNRLPATEIELAERRPAGALRRHYALFGVRCARSRCRPTCRRRWSGGGVRRDPRAAGADRRHGLPPVRGPRSTKALFELCQARPAEAARFREKPPAGRLSRYEDVGRSTTTARSPPCASAATSSRSCGRPARRARAAATCRRTSRRRRRRRSRPLRRRALRDAGHRAALRRADDAGRRRRTATASCACSRPACSRSTSATGRSGSAARACSSCRAPRLAARRRARSTDLNPCPHPMA